MAAFVFNKMSALRLSQILFFFLINFYFSPQNSLIKKNAAVCAVHLDQGS